MGRIGPLVLVLLLAGAVGCADDDREEDARQTSERFLAALESRDGAAACAELYEGTARELEDFTGRRCEESILGLEITGSRTAGASVYVRSATVEVTDGGSLFLDETSQGWRITAAGCEPRPSLPYDCALED